MSGSIFKNNFALYFFLFLGLLTLSLVVYIGIKEAKKKEKQQSEIYTPYIDKWINKNDSIFGKVTSVYIERSTAYCVVDDSIYLKIDSQNNYYEEKLASKIIEAGDTMRKIRGSELFFIIHGGNEYMFHINKVIDDGKVLEPQYSCPSGKEIHDSLLKYSR